MRSTPDIIRTPDTNPYIPGTGNDQYELDADVPITRTPDTTTATLNPDEVFADFVRHADVGYAISAAVVDPPVQAPTLRHHRPSDEEDADEPTVDLAAQPSETDSEPDEPPRSSAGGPPKIPPEDTPPPASGDLPDDGKGDGDQSGDPKYYEGGPVDWKSPETEQAIGRVVRSIFAENVLDPRTEYKPDPKTGPIADALINELPSTEPADSEEATTADTTPETPEPATDTPPSTEKSPQDPHAAARRSTLTSFLGGAAAGREALEHPEQLQIETPPAEPPTGPTEATTDTPVPFLGGEQAPESGMLTDAERAELEARRAAGDRGPEVGVDEDVLSRVLGKLRGVSPEEPLAGPVAYQEGIDQAVEAAGGARLAEALGQAEQPPNDTDNTPPAEPPTEPNE
jgi:hypothetical protein